MILIAIILMCLYLMISCYITDKKENNINY